LVQEARAKFKTQVAALDKAKFEKARSLHAKFDAALAQNISLLKQRQLLADAVLLAGKREEIAREWLPPAATAGSADAKEKKSAPLTHMGLKESIPWLLEKGAKLRYKSAKKQVLLKDPQPLLSGHVEFSSVSLVSCAAENNGPEIQDRDFDRLAPLRGTRSLVISGFKIGDSAFTFLEAWKEMEDFTLMGALVTDKLASRLAKFPMLREVSVARCEKVTGDFVHQLAATLPKLEALHLNDVDLGDQSVDDLLSFKRLTSLKLRGTRITDQGLARIAALKTLKDLDVGNTKVTLAGLGSLSGLKLSALGFLSTDSPSFATDVAEVAKVLPKLEGLSLTGSEFRLEHAEALTAFRELRSLSMMDTSPKGPALAALQKLKNLESFRCQHAGFGDDELGGLAENKHLKNINVNNTSITNAGLLKLSKNRDLKEVSAISTAATEVGAAGLEKAISGIRIVH
jgi:hypothetical protein